MKFIRVLKAKDRTLTRVYTYVTNFKIVGEQSGEEIYEEALESFNRGTLYGDEPQRATYLNEDIELRKERQNYFDKQNMTQYLKSDCVLGTDDTISYIDCDPNNIISIRWIFESANAGRIELKTRKLMDEQILNQISYWVSGQNSDGVGEGFEEQSFGGEFDWKTNKYKFQLI